MSISKNFPALVLTALATAAPTAVFADTGAAIDRVRLITDAHGDVPGSLTIGLATVLLLGIAAMLLTGRLGVRLCAAIIILCCALFGGSAIIDGFQTAVAVSQ